MDQAGATLKPGIITIVQAQEGEFARTINGYDESVRQRKLTTDQIRQQYEYHRLLDPDDSGIEDPCAHEDDDGITCLDHRKPVKVPMDHALLVAIDDDPLDPGNSDACPNTKRTKKNRWFNDPKLKPTSMGMGFLSQIAHLCYVSGVSSCRNEDCRSYYHLMSSRAPQCGWEKFTDWAITAMSCQAAMADKRNYGSGHTHLARSVVGCCMIVKEFRDKNCLHPHMDGDQETQIDLVGVIDLIYWMGKIQYEKTIGPDNFGSWGTQPLPPAISMDPVRTALEELDKIGICKNRFWSFAGVGDRKQADIPDIVKALKPPRGTESDSGLSPLAHRPRTGNSGSAVKSTDAEDLHKHCNAAKCQQSSISSTDVQQMHKCENGCKNLKVLHNDGLERENAALANDPVVEAVNSGGATAWNLQGTDLISKDEPYMAVSHVWADGTGQGNHPQGEVNECLFNFWRDVARDVECEGIWWDVISVPSKSHKEEYKKSLETMHMNYYNAKVTVVHDKYLLGIPWTETMGETGLACIALVLSTWFTRGWTALELARSKKVKVLFGKSGDPGGYVIKDLEDDILAETPAKASRAHWLATAWIKRLREPINDIGDVLAILNSRTTETVRDRTLIAGLLADIPDLDVNRSQGSITRHILRYLGRIPQACLLHGEATMADSGRFSWCAASLDEMPIPLPYSMESREASDHVSMMEINQDGEVQGFWYCRNVNEEEKDNIHAYGNDLSSSVKVTLALTNPKSCLLLRPLGGSKEDKTLLVKQKVPFDGITAVECDYVGAVVQEDTTNFKWHYINIRFSNKASLENDYTEVSNETVHQDGEMCDRCLADGERPGEEQQGAEKAVSGGDTESLQQQKWLDGVLDVDYTTPQVRDASPEDDGSETLDLEQLQNLLQPAINKENYEAVQHIVKLLVQDDIELVQNMKQFAEQTVQQVAGDNSAPQPKDGLWLLGDALVSQRSFQAAAYVYENALKVGYSSPSFVDAALNYNLGMVETMLGQKDSGKRRFQEALSLFNNHKDTDRLSTHNGPINNVNTPKLNFPKAAGQKGNKIEDWHAAAEGWYSVWFNSTAALILLSDPYDEKEWWEMLLKAFKLILNNDVFKEELDENGQSGPDLEKVADFTYHALMKFDMVFHRDHPLVFITAITVGKESMRWAHLYGNADDHIKALRNWRNAYGQFVRAREGLSTFGFICHRSRDDNHPDINDPWIEYLEGKIEEANNGIKGVASVDVGGRDGAAQGQGPDGITGVEAVDGSVYNEPNVESTEEDA